MGYCYGNAWLQIGKGLNLSQFYYNFAAILLYNYIIKEIILKKGFDLVKNMQDLAKYIEHTLLLPGATIENVTNICGEVEKYGFLGVCVNSGYVALAAHLLAGKEAKIVSTCGFPLGAVRTEVKAFEAQKAAEDKADEIDMVMNLSAAKSGNWDAVTEDIRAVVAAAGVPVKVIIETNLLSDAEKELACKAVMAGGAFCVKTCTSGMDGGVKLEDVILLKKIVGDRLKIKASGGIRTRSQVISLIKAGADYIGTSTGPLFAKVAEDEQI